MGPALQLADTRDDPHLDARRMIIIEEHPVIGRLETLGNPLCVAGTDFAIRSAPSLGEHTDEVLADMGCTAAELAELRSAGVIR